MARLREGGYSLYELLLTLGLLALLLGLGLPSFGFLMADQRLRVESDALFHAVHLARKQSITLRRVVTLCPSVDGEFCDPGQGWSAGWILFANAPGTVEGQRDANEPVLWRHQVGTQGVNIMSNRSHYSFRSTVRRATNGTLRFCDAADRAPSRALIVSYTGRPRVAYQDTRGRPYSCAQ